MSVNEMELQKFNLPESASGDFDLEDLADDLDGLRMDFPHVRIPTGGSLMFEIPSGDPESPDYAKNMEGIIVYNHSACAYWPGTEEDGDENKNPPMCMSLNGNTGIGEPGGTCLTCELNQFGTDEKGRGKACKNMRVLYLLRDGEFMPLQISLPPTSIRPFSEFVNAAFAVRRRGVCGSIVQIGLKRIENGNTPYSVATFKKLRDFEGEELAQVIAYAKTFKEQVKEMNQQRIAAMAESEPANDYAECGDYGTASGDLSFDPASINGDFEEIPA